ncbi:hypothetical protein TPHA_0A00860 [Tetrapisispora phaffii CBS 4417]|uniref:FAD synthase n=1 Tax=Tetrapisispora phaffii (strain ATCC 24235 / CBS 4417 / NBRC 1672 / NRRL Y-8282 / UCD 70-5) TaxID=1071381 RepID=G8BMP3_TETPH|nr:hypothetical protein TPHA_0A00860 [Tetrapisispora phaffii CBS 4417]CCE61171.1 hypothetical protein TPHA_0A00860 [Tetrapisispora phaffii CBS 4417]
MISLEKVSQLCYNITESYLSLNNSNSIIQETQLTLQNSRRDILNTVFTNWNPFGSKIAFSYNGGKDCQVLLILYLSCLWEYFYTFAQQSQYGMEYMQFPISSVSSVLISNDVNFLTMEHFIKDTVDRYHLDMYDFSNAKNSVSSKKNMADLFQDYLDDKSEIEAIVVGVRHSDPYSENLSLIDMTDEGWPNFYRVQPLLDWHLTNIWSFLIYSGEPICGLYGEGYTSIGDIDNTLPNPNLNTNEKHQFYFSEELKSAFNRNRNQSTEIGIDNGDQDFKVNLSNLDKSDRQLLHSYNATYYPGWYLIDEKLERAGRIKKPKN